MVTGSSNIRVVRKEDGGGAGSMIHSVHVRDEKIKNFVSMGNIVYELTELGGEEEDVFRFVAVKVTQKEEPSIRMLHFEEVIVHSNVVREKSLFVRIWFGVDSTNYGDFEGRM